MRRALMVVAMVGAMVGLAACKGGATGGSAADTAGTAAEVSALDTVPQYRETGDVHLSGTQAEYVLIFSSWGCLERMLRDIGDDTARMDDFYTAEDDRAYYVYECAEMLEAMGVKFHEMSADRTVHCADGSVYTPQDSCTDGVLVVEPGREPVLLDLMDFLFGPAAEGRPAEINEERHADER